MSGEWGVSGERWQLVHRGRVVAELEITGGDWPFLDGRVHPKEGFEDVEGLLAEEAALFAHFEEGPEQRRDWEDALHRMEAAIDLVAPTGYKPEWYVLHVWGHEARWRAHQFGPDFPPPPLTEEERRLAAFGEEPEG